MVIRLGHPPCPRLAPELLPNPVPRLPVDDRRMKAVVALPFVGLLIATAKSSYDTKDANLRSFAADIIVLDETLRDDGDEALTARRALRDYANQLLRDVWPETGASPYLIENKEAFKFLERMRGEIDPTGRRSYGKVICARGCVAPSDGEFTVLDGTYSRNNCLNGRRKRARGGAVLEQGASWRAQSVSAASISGAAACWSRSSSITFRATCSNI